MRYKMMSVILTLVCALTSIALAQSDQEGEVKRIAVLQLTNRLEVSPAEIDYLTGIVRLEAAKRLPRDYLVMTQENILSLLPPEKTLEDCQGECEVDVGRLLGARYIITGEVLRFGSSLRLTLRLHDTSTGRLISSEIAKAKQLEDLEEPTATSIKSLLQSLTPAQSLKGRAARSIEALEQEGGAQKPKPVQPSPPARRAPVQRSRPSPPSSAPPPSTNTRPPVGVKGLEVAPHPRFELQLGYSASSCSPNGELDCALFNQTTPQRALNDFGVQYRLAQLATLSFAVDLRYTTNQLRTAMTQHRVSTLSAGFVTTYKTGPWYGRLQLGLGVQDGAMTGDDVKLSYRGGALRFGGEGGMMIGAFSLSLYLQNEAIPQETELCVTAQGQEGCRDGWSIGVRQVGFRMGVVWGE